jgi:choline dehydrogenase-like flavoprotein
MTRITADILIIGSGAAGGVLAATLADLPGKRIVLLEKGGHYGGDFFTQREWDTSVLYAGRGARSTVDGAIVVRGGECVGGGTTVNYALALDPVQAVWARWRAARELTGFSFDPAAADYGVSGLNMASCLAEVRARINVHTPGDEEINDNNRVLERGLRAMGLSSKRFPLNMRGCIGCGFCAEGCAYDRKQSTLVTYVPDALARGVQLIHHCEVERLIFERRAGALTVTGAHARVRPTRTGSQPNSVEPGGLDIRATVVLVCCGSIESPTLLQRSGHSDPHDQIGRGLILHPGLPVIGVMPTRTTNYRGITGTIYSDHFYESHGFYYECLFGHPVYGAVVVPGIGPDHFDVMRKYERLAGFGVMLIDTAVGTNRVRWHPPSGERRISYHLADGDKARLRVAAKTGVDIMFAAGAEEVLLASQEPLGSLPSPRFRSASESSAVEYLRFEPYHTPISSAHCQATVKMGASAASSVVNARGESHHVRNLLVCDSSVFPDSCGANPMLSVMTLARYQGRRIVAEWDRYAS